MMANQYLSLKKNYIYIFVIYSVLISIYFLPLCIEGDQEHYRNFYNTISNQSIIEGYISQNGIIGTQEPGYFIVAYTFSKYIGLDKDILMSAINGILSYLVIKWLVENKVSFLILILISTNFYLFVLFFSAERLKLALIFYLLSIMVTNKYRYFFIISFIFTHVQLVLLLISKILEDFFESVKYLVKMKMKKKSLSLFVLIIMISVVFFVLKDHILFKIDRYSKEMEVIGISKILIFLFLSIYYAQNKRIQAITLFLPLIAGTALFGSDRFVILAYFIFMYYALQVKNGLNFAVIITSFYFSLKGLMFISDIISYGDGFHNAVLNKM